MANAAVTWWSDGSSRQSGSLRSPELPRHFAAQSLGAPRTPRSGSAPRSLREMQIAASGSSRGSAPRSLREMQVARLGSSPRSIRELRHAAAPTSVVPIPIEPVTGPSMPLGIGDPTVSRARKTTFRAGASAPEKSSLSIFVLIGLVVGLFAFLMMTFCLPDPGDRIAARAAMEQQFAPPPVAAPVFVQVEPAPMATAPMAAAPIAPAVGIPDGVSVAATQPLVRMLAPARPPHARHRLKHKAALPTNPYETL